MDCRYYCGGDFVEKALYLVGACL